MCMPKNLNTWINEIKTSLNNKGYSTGTEIPLTVFRSEFMILSGYGRLKVVEWVDNFHRCKLIEIKDDKVRFL